jgi:hypothetical protein
MILRPAPEKLRRFAVRGILRQEWRFAGRRSSRKVFFENRILLLDATTEREARNTAHRLFKATEYVAEWPAPDVARNALTYLGISKVVEFGPEMDPEEVWWEYVDERPRIEERPRSSARRSARSR